MNSEEKCVWVILHDTGFGHSWTALAFWGAAESYEVALEKLTKVVGPPNVITGSDKADEKTIYVKGRVWLIRKVAL